MRGPKKYHSIDISWWIIVGLAVVLVLLFSPTWTQDIECDGGPCGEFVDLSSTTLSGSDTVAFGFGSPSYDVDINNCTGSTSRSFVFGLFSHQRLQEIHFCHAMNLISAGYVDAGNWLLCNKTKMSEMPDCPGTLFLPDQPTTSTEREDQQQMLGNHDNLQMSLMSLQAQFDDLEKMRQDAITRYSQAQKVLQVQQQEQQQREVKEAARRAATRAALEKKEQT